eukprot:TRINITY_DN19815_c0_g1_i1.p1 TRINITY_DN19815_c0_g1~~TRINITY_DN19815_c0_g1_i1.p1  ORF type:complete len:306 (-),score=29.23 TRINITY_DN19815_c0_g1_i1:60-917(-)
MCIRDRYMGMIENLLTTGEKYFFTCAEKGVDMFRDSQRQATPEEFTELWIELSKYMRIPRIEHWESRTHLRSMILGHKQAFESLVEEMDTLKNQVFDLASQFDKGMKDQANILAPRQMASFTHQMEQLSQTLFPIALEAEPDEERIDHAKCRQSLKENLLCECIKVDEQDTQAIKAFQELKKELSVAEETANKAMKFIDEKKRELEKGNPTALVAISELLRQAPSNPRALFIISVRYSAVLINHPSNIFFRLSLLSSFFFFVLRSFHYFQQGNVHILIFLSLIHI